MLLCKILDTFHTTASVQQQWLQQLLCCCY
jgi:hypothetical protein